MFHKPVMLAEAIDSLEIKENGIYVDLTFGGGGHSKEILKRINNDGKLIIIELKTGNVLKVEKIARNILSKPFLYNNYLFMIKNGAVVQYE